VRCDVKLGPDPPPCPPPPPGVQFGSCPESPEIIEFEKRKDASLILILCSELRRQYKRFRGACRGGGEGERGGPGTDRSTSDWIKKCCCALSSLCYYGDSSSSMEGDT
jgi:hypothetical protein